MAIKYKWLAGRLKELMVTNIEQGVNRLPTEEELCRRYQVSRQTVRRALSLLTQEGLIERRQGSGSYCTGLSADTGRNVICILITDDSDYLYPAVLEDLRTAFGKSGFAVRIYVTRGRFADERDILLTLLRHPPLGIVAEGCKSALPNPNLSLYRKLSEAGCALLFLYAFYPAFGDCLYVKDDNIGGGALLASHLAAQGHTAIGGIFKSDDLQGQERFQGFMEAMQERGIAVPDERINWYDSRDLERLSRLQDTRFLQEIIGTSLSSCTAVLCHDDRIAYHLLRELRRADFRLPEDMAVAAFDNTYLSRSSRLSVTSLTHRPHEMGERAAALLLDKLKGLPAVSQEVPWKLLPKESTSGSAGQP